MAVCALSDWSRSKEYAQDLLDQSCRRAGLSAPDSAFLHTIVLAVIRNFSLLDHWIGELCSHGHLDHRTRDVLRVGLTQLLILDLAPHAAVNETVAIAGKARNLVNAVLRRADREKASLLEAARRLPLAVRTSHPAFLVDRWIRHLGEQKTAEICEWNQMPAQTFVRVNALRTEASAWFENSPGFEAVGDDFFQCDTFPREAVTSGLCYVQDPSTGMAPRLLSPQRGETVLDACAAPGGKAAYMAALMGNEGRIIACDVSASRLRRVVENLERLGVKNTECHAHDITSSCGAPWGELKFDRILLDVPCSNTGVMRRRVDVRWRLQAGDFVKLGQQQERLLDTGLKLLKPGGTLVYSTCSIDADENQEVVKRVLANHPSARLEEEIAWLPSINGFDGAYAARISVQ
jgi:16S rRNA (cytosine967-C5)-methyltransferase